MDTTHKDAAGSDDSDWDDLYGETTQSNVNRSNAVVAQRGDFDVIRTDEAIFPPAGAVIELRRQSAEDAPALNVTDAVVGTVQPIGTSTGATGPGSLPLAAGAEIVADSTAHITADIATHSIADSAAHSTHAPSVDATITQDGSDTNVDNNRSAVAAKNDATITHPTEQLSETTAQPPSPKRMKFDITDVEDDVGPLGVGGVAQVLEHLRRSSTISEESFRGTGSENSLTGPNENPQAVEIHQDDTLSADPTGETAPDSDPESSSGSSDSDSDSDSEASDAETGSAMNHEEMAKMLMREEGEDGDRGGGGPPRTANEKAEVIPPKPQISITEDTKVTLLGQVMHFAESRLVIAGTPGMAFDKIPSIEAPLCNAARKVIGAINDVMGTTANPFFLIIISEDELDTLGLQPGAQIFSVDAHTTFENVAEMKAKKYTDASNINDEEAGDDELEFSDDEVEQEYKRMNKASKKDGKGKLSREDFTRNVGPAGPDGYASRRGRGGRGPRTRGNDRGGRGGRGGYDNNRYDDGGFRRYAPSNDDVPTWNHDVNYGDENGRPTSPPADGYTPLKRPDNLSEMMRTGGPVRNNARGNGNARVRPYDNNRGRGNNDRGGRGSNNNYGAPAARVPHPLPQAPPLAAQPQSYPIYNPNAYAGYTAPATANSYTAPAALYSYAAPGTNNTYTAPTTNTAYAAPGTAAPTSYTPVYQQPAYNAQAYAQYSQAYQAQQPQTYQFNGQTYQYGQGAYNPNFTGGQWGQGQQK
ncbi:hypothetical protein B0A48_10709 [Cryoendolithus antarcticus]|uniref:H/ACA ribonucleoprotein complex non-core subunit NAF1 n=1 Tax=Cryoendolithus antarcticus TaxID=1507870 RepID=A0A1V8SY28_9PEZI|nr:hypothetical protein B0A48_10709 [Cryoendolithus antarcticus]